MPSVLCPECNHRIKIREDEGRTALRCTECGHRVSLVGAEQKAKEGSRANKKKAKKSDQDLSDQTWLAWLPVLILGPLALLMIVLSLRSSTAAALAIALGQISFIALFIWGTRLAARDNFYVGWDYLSSFGSARWLIIWLLLPIYVAGYVVYMLFTQLQAAFHRPARYLGVIGAEFAALLLIVSAPFTLVVRQRAQELRSAEEFRASQEEERVAKKQAEEMPKKVRPPVVGASPVDQVLTGLASNDATECRAALKLLSSIQVNEFRGEIAKRLAALALRSPDDVRTQAAAALEAWATSAEAPALVELLGKSNTAARIHVVKALGGLKDPKTVDPLVAQVNDPATGSHALAALKKMGPVAEQRIVAMLQGSSRSERARAARILRDIGTEESLPALRAQCKDFDPDLRGPAQEAVKAIEGRIRN